jgi:hypothetical protein
MRLSQRRRKRLGALEAKPQKPSKVRRYVFWGVFALVVLLVPYFMSLTNTPEKRRDIYCTQKGGIIEGPSLAEEFVRRSLKAPSTAYFPSSGAAEHKGGCDYLVVGDVDAENAFGARLGPTTRCQLHTNRKPTRGV